MENRDQHIRERWFPEHKATLTQHGDLQVLQWAKPGTGTYSCRYIFDGSKIYISGDIGSSVFWLTWKADVHSFKDINIDYFEEKLEAYSGERREFNHEKAVQNLKEWQDQLDEDEVEYDADEFEGLMGSVESCSSKNEWAHEYVNGTYHDFIRDLDSDFWDWIYDIGDEMPMRIKGYLVGLKMASEQILAAEQPKAIETHE